MNKFFKYLKGAIAAACFLMGSVAYFLTAYKDVGFDLSPGVLGVWCLYLFIYFLICLFLHYTLLAFDVIDYD
jgi:hypothetical protein